MRLLFVVLGSFGAATAAVLGFMMAGFAVVGEGKSPQPLSSYLSASICLVPILCAARALVPWWGFLQGWNTSTYWWYAGPVVILILHGIVIFTLMPS